MSPHRIFGGLGPVVPDPSLTPEQHQRLDRLIDPPAPVVDDPAPDPAAAVHRYLEYIRLLEDVADQVGKQEMFWCSTPVIDPNSTGGGDLREMACGECAGCRLETAANALREFQKATYYWPRGRSEASND